MFRPNVFTASRVLRYTVQDIQKVAHSSSGVDIAPRSVGSEVLGVCRRTDL